MSFSRFRWDISTWSKPPTASLHFVTCKTCKIKKQRCGEITFT